jgi:ABC-type phosphate transport system auxiliary subunit
MQYQLKSPLPLWIWVAVGCSSTALIGSIGLTVLLRDEYKGYTPDWWQCPHTPYLNQLGYCNDPYTLHLRW